jgi:hypothetical protein
VLLGALSDPSISSNSAETVEVGRRRGANRLGPFSDAPLPNPA